VVAIEFQLPPITAYQRDAIFCAERNAIIEATTKAGKSIGAMFWLLLQAFNTNKCGAEFWWVAPVYEQTKIIYRRYKTLLRQTDPDGSEWRCNDTDPSITLGNGTVLRFKSAEKPDNLFGEDVHAAVLDEASRMREEAFIAVRTTLTATNGRLRIIGNVKGRKNWAYRLARRVETDSLPGWKYSKITAHDAVKAGIISADEVEAAKREMPEAAFRELYLAEPSEDGANPFGLQHIAACLGPLSTEEPQTFGIDLAKSQDFTVVVGLDAKRRVCVFDRWQHLPWEATMGRILGHIGGKPTLVDSTGVGDPIVESLSRRNPAVEGYKFTATSRQQLMEGLALSIQQKDITVLDGVMRIELESFEFQQTKVGVKYAAPEGHHDDCAVALALAAERSRRYTPVVCTWAGGYPPKPPFEGSVEQWFEEQRKDPNWGFSDSRGQEWVTPAERYGHYGSRGRYN
jgi:hypothetical protein